METKLRLFMFLILFGVLVTVFIHSKFGIRSIEFYSPSKQMIVEFVDFLHDKLYLRRQSSSDR